MTFLQPLNDGSIPVQHLSDFARRVLESAGACRPDAEITADALTTADAFGVFTHGTKLLPGYLRRLKAGGIRSDGKPRIVDEGPAWAVIDGDAAMGQVIGVFAMDVAMRKARSCGIGYAGVQNSNHFGAAGYYPLRAVKEQMIGLAMCNDTPSVAAPGSRGAIVGTNPIAYAIPAGDRDPIFFDAAMSTVAGGKVYAALQLGKAIPGDWLIGPDGHPTSEGALYPDFASLAPMGGHKGYGIALLIETLSGILTGAGVTRQVRSWMAGEAAEPTLHGAAFVAIDCRVISSSNDFEKRVQGLMDEIHAAPAADGVEAVMVPGEREWTAWRRAVSAGIMLPPDVSTKLVEAAQMAGIDINRIAGEPTSKATTV